MRRSGKRDSHTLASLNLLLDAIKDTPTDGAVDCRPRNAFRIDLCGIQ